MSDLVVFTYQHEDKAAEVLKEIGKLKQENVQKALIGIEDAAVAFKTPEGKLKVHQTLESVAKGSTIASGSLWGLLIGLYRFQMNHVISLSQRPPMKKGVLRDEIWLRTEKSTTSA
jgi:uncharacterized membrane protein